MHIKAVWGVLSLVALTLGTTRMPSAASLECARTSLSSVSTCGAADRLRPTTRGQIPHTKRLKPVSEQGLPNLSDTARAGSEARSCDVSRQISKKTGDTALSKNCFMGPETTRATLAEKAPAPPLRFRDGSSIRPADPVVVVGFPYAGLLTQSPQVTTGVISALAGIHDDSRYVQLTAPVQPGSSGGPLLDSSGNVIGIVSSKLDTMAAADW